MSRAFQNGAFNANNTFGKLYPSIFASDHIQNVKARSLYCSNPIKPCNLKTQRYYKPLCDVCNCISDPNDPPDDIASVSEHSFNSIHSNVYAHQDKKRGKDAFSYDYLLSVKRGLKLKEDDINEVPPFDQMDLVSNLYTLVDLSCALTVCQGSAICRDSKGINPDCKPMYQYYRIDPEGCLFGDAPCSMNNYLKYVRLE